MPVPTLDQTRKQAHLEFARTPARLIGDEADGWPVLRRVLEVAAILLAAEQVGGASRVVDMAAGYAGTRVQFGRPIGSFQAIKHMCADMLTEAEAARSAAYHGLWTLAAGRDDVPLAASVAKVYCSAAYCRIAGDAIQVHGGIGFTWEHPAHLHFKRAKASEAMFGTPGYHRDLVGLLGLDRAAGARRRLDRGARNERQGPAAAGGQASKATPKRPEASGRY